MRTRRGPVTRSGTAHQVREVSRWSMVTGPDGLKEERPADPAATPVLPLPPEVEAKRKAAAEARR
ncbi:hypothetical protein OG413_43520 [Streptomyces sp. NBC_01433]|uniref:hypothetical protein n=1 Tax=Streptomyces sp. NBC_01433 TaxID=2903864 RepID=UPI00224CA933|nr:hypothetical protein [Streptomyces sp. NBC_01433]MCX4682054.1 hypothetical protein [Streptomyces sp. NBC_01433]